MISRKSYLVLAVFLFLFNISALRSQVNNIGIAINEYCAANINGPVDNFGILSDWVEIINVDPSPVSLNGYWLSNDRLNPKKWAFPNGFTLQPGEIKVIWLSGRVGNGGGAFHANFTIDQCKNQWLVLSPPGDGIPRDSTIVRPMQAGHSWGRISYEKTGLEEFRLYTSSSVYAAKLFTKF